MKDRNHEHTDHGALPGEHPARRTHRDDAFSEFLPGALDRTLGLDGAPRRHKELEPGSGPSTNS